MAVFDTVARLAVMIVAKAGVSRETLTNALTERRNALFEALDGAAELRLGLRCQPDPLEGTMGERAMAGIDAAVEFTATRDRLDFLFARAPVVAGLLQDLLEPGETLLMGGPTHRIVEPRGGEVFLSLAFRRDPGIRVDEFRSWWFQQHAPLAVSLLGAELLAYDQVHVDHAASKTAAAAAGLRYDDFDGYDNLTWASAADFLASVSAPDTQRQLYEDEQGHLDNTSNRAALMLALPG